MSEDREPYGTRRPAALHPWTLRLEDGAEVTLEAPDLRAALDVLQRRQITRRIQARAPVVGAARADHPDRAAQLRLAVHRLRNALHMIEAHPAEHPAAIQAMRDKAHAALSMTDGAED